MIEAIERHHPRTAGRLIRVYLDLITTTCALPNVSTYVEGTQRCWIGIVRSGKDACRWYAGSDLDAFALEAQRLFDEDHLRIMQLEMLD